MKHTGFTWIILVLVVGACVKIQPVSPIPEIHFKSLKVGLFYDSLLQENLPGATLVFSFIDGDADFGVYQQVASDTTLPDSVRYNIFMTPYYKIDSVYYKIKYPIVINKTDTLPPPYYTVTYNSKLDRVGENKTIKGDISINMIDLPQYDTIRYKFYIKDRAGHRSNVETTTDIGVKGLLKNGS